MSGLLSHRSKPWRAGLGIGLACVSLAASTGFVTACDAVYADPITTAPVPFAGSAVDGGLRSDRRKPLSCPRAEEIRENGPCRQAGDVCEVGTSADMGCNARFICTSAGPYGSAWNEQSRGSCRLQCPAAELIVDGAPCDVGDAGGAEAELHCTTPRGTCACTTGPGGARVHPQRWVCTTPNVGCPPERPLHGQPCFGTSLCDYGACTSKRGVRMICEDDVWQVEGEDACDD